MHKLKSIPAFKTEAEERKFWETHDSTDYIDWSKAERVRFPNLKPSNLAGVGTMREYDRRIALGSWGERKALVLLDRAGFSKVRDVNVETFNHPFGDIYAERAGKPYLIGVKTRNKFRDIGLVNEGYNIQKKGVDVQAIARPYKAELAWVTIQVVPELQIFWSYFGTIALINEHHERFSIPMRATETSRYERLANEETDTAISPQWSNGGYGRSRD